MARGIKFEFDADTARMERGLQRAENALEDMQREARQTDVALRSMPNEINVGVDFDSGNALVRAQALGGQLEAAVGEVDVGVDFDTGGASREGQPPLAPRMEAAVGDINVGMDLSGREGRPSGSGLSAGGSLGINAIIGDVECRYRHSQQGPARHRRPSSASSSGWTG